MKYTVGTIPGKAKNHTIYENGITLCEIQGGGYPVGEGWAPHTEAKAHEIARKLNHYDTLLEALKAIQHISDHVGNGPDEAQEMGQLAIDVVALVNAA